MLALATIASATPVSARIMQNDPSIVRPDGPGPDALAGGGQASASARKSGGGDSLSIARRYLGSNPTGRSSLWCADFINLVERKAGREGVGSRLATAYLDYGTKVSKPQPGDIVVLTRRGGGHVGYFVGWDDGKIVLLSGNHGRKVAIGTYPTSRVLGYRRP
ncbi:TIGR02594 family protein [Tepidamorphus gemmatus]|nr:TIGR02594 family protein [Tepidamorphus gemmatus]